MSLPHLAKRAETQTLANLDDVLADAGLDRSSVVKTTVWIRAAGDFAGFDAAPAKDFGSHHPARSTVACDLVAPKALLEIEALAALRS